MKIVIAIFGTVYLTACLLALTTEIRSLQVLSFAVYSEVSSDTFSGYHLTAEKLLANSPQSCRRDIRTARATISISSYQLMLSEIESSSKKPPTDSEVQLNLRNMRLRNAYEELLFSLRCTPFDGNAWFRLAWLTNESKTAITELKFSDLLNSSIVMSPLEYFNISGRILVAADKITEENVDLQNYIAHDLRNLIYFGKIGDIVNTLNQISDIPLSIASDILNEIPDEKSTKIFLEYYKN